MNRVRVLWVSLALLCAAAAPARAQSCPEIPLPPVITPSGGLYNFAPLTVEISAPGYTILYSTDGSAPARTYSTPLSLTRTTTVKAKAGCYVYPAWRWSEVVTRDYILQVGRPSWEPKFGEYEPGVFMTPASSTSSAWLRYRYDGQTPSDSDPLVPSGGRLLVGPTTLSVRGFSGEMDPSATETNGTYSLRWNYNNGSVATGEGFSVALKPDGTVWTWGSNSSRQLGHGERPNGSLLLSQSPIPTNAGVSGVRAIATGAHSVVALRHDGTVYTWGSASYGALGRDGCTVPYSSPGRCVRPESIGLANVIGIAAGTYHGLALDVDGYVWSWGYNIDGQLGDGTTTSRSQPQLVVGLTEVVEVAASSNASYARRSDGTVWVWGKPYLGDGSGNLLGTVKTPVQVGGLPAGITRIWAGHGNGYALASDSTLWVWGRASNGQLGFGNTYATPNFMPAPHTALGPVLSVTGGEQHTVLVLSSGGTRSMGANVSGELGDGTTTQRVSPTAVAAVPLMRRVASYWHHTVGIGQDGSLWAWGQNSYGQIGNNATANAVTPVEVFPAGTFDGCWSSVVTPSPVAVTESGGVSTVGVDTAFDCEWTVISDQPWAQPGAGRIGSGSFALTVDANPGPPRSATLTLLARWSGDPLRAIRTVTVNQEGFAIVPPTNEEISYFHTDAIGSVRMITSDSGTVLARYDYLPFGTEWTTSFSNIANNVKFTGQERDVETAGGSWGPQDYFGARTFQSQIGRFTRPDEPGYGNPFDPQSMNLYAYALNNPLRWVDPTGHNPECPTDHCESITVTAPRPSDIDIGTWRFFLDSWLNFERQFPRTSGFLEGSTQAATTLFTSPRQSCLAQVGLNTLWNLAPVKPGVTAFVETAAAGAALLEWNRAQRYAASRPNVMGGRGLLYPNRSSVYRGMVNRSKLIVGKAGPVAAGVLAIGEAIVAEAAAWQAGTCR